MEEHATISACTVTKREKWELRLPLMMEKSLPVSYTHLDVYKRQAQYKAHIEMLINIDKIKALQKKNGGMNVRVQ